MIVPVMRTLAPLVKLKSLYASEGERKCRIRTKITEDRRTRENLRSGYCSRLFGVLKHNYHR